ncbi:MAG: hypothetical protein AABY78_06995 [Nitrospirota bacterium]
MPTKEEIEEENKKIRHLRFIIDFTTNIIMQTDTPLSEAQRMIEGTRRFATTLFPGKEEVYDLIYKPRFRRILSERYVIPGSRG